MTEDWTPLRWFWIDGPALPGGRPLWSLRAGAAYAKRNHTIDQVHPIRSLMIDGAESTIKAENGRKFHDGASSHRLRAPRLFSIHLAAGATEGARKLNSTEILSLALTTTGQRCEARNVEGKSPAFATPGGEFVHVLAEPIPVDGSLGDFVDQAGKNGNGDNPIRMPRLRLVEGAIRLMLPGPRTWLGNLDAAPSKPLELLLTREGVQIVTTAPFPGLAQPVAGGFMIVQHPAEAASISAGQQSALALVLLPEHPQTRLAADDWMAAWASVAARSEKPGGIAFRARPSGRVPAFRWPIQVADGKPMLASPDQAALEAPVADMLAELRGGPGTDGTPEGAALLRLSRLWIATRAAAGPIVTGLERRGMLPFARLPEGGVVLIAEALPEAMDGKAGAGRQPTGSAAPPTCWLEMEIGDKTTLRLRPGGDRKAIPLVHDERRLAADLRRAYGWPEPDTTPTTEPRPIVPGFVPLSDGWLQMPLPNLPLPDAQKDSSLIAQQRGPGESVLDGFIRVSERMKLGRVSAYSRSPSPPAAQAPTPPWSLTVETAQAAVVLATVSKEGRLTAAQVMLRQPQLSARGLVWLSIDRPTAIEALPRLSAGPGSFIAPDLRSANDTAGRIVTGFLLATAGKAAGDPLLSISYDGQTVKRDGFALSFTFDELAAAWLQGPARGRAARMTLAQARDVLLDSPVPGVEPGDLINARQDLAIVEANARQADRALASAELRLLELERMSAEAHGRTMIAQAEKARADKLARDPRSDTRHAQMAQQEAEAVLAAAKAASAPIEEELKQLRNNRTAHQAKATAAREDRNRAAAKLAEIDTSDLLPAEPWPAVAWRAHPHLPLASTMPMTRSAASAVSPLESRALAPLVAARATDGRGVGVLAALSFSDSGRGLVELGPVPAFDSLARRWPGSQPNGGEAQTATSRPESGVPFAALGVPGAEVYPAPGWDRLTFAARFDLPALDEAFASAGLPPASTEPQAAPPVLATALDWPSLGRFWAEQGSRRELSLVVDSYLDGFKPAQQPQILQVDTLVQGSRWTVTATFDASRTKLSYGSLAFGDFPVLRGNAALRGLNGLVAMSGGTPEISLLGWTPATWDSDGFRFDNQGMGLGAAAQTGALLSRPFRRRQQTGRFVSALEGIAVRADKLRLGFWYRDVPLDAADTYIGHAEGVDVGAWQDPLAGMEWRFYSERAEDSAAGEGDPASRAFASGRDQIDFFGLQLEPLRLLRLELGTGTQPAHVPARVEILARLSLPLAAAGLPTGGNVVRLCLLRDGDTLSLGRIETEGELAFSIPLTKRASDGALGYNLSNLVLRFAVEWIASGPAFQSAVIESTFLGCECRLDGVNVSTREGGLHATWKPADPPALPAGSARLRITHLALAVQAEAGIEMTTVIEIAPDDGDDVSRVPAAPAPAIRIDRDGLSCLGMSLSGRPSWQEAEGAVVLAGKGSGSVSGLVQGFPTGTGKFAWMIAAHVLPGDAPGVFSLAQGRCEGEVRLDPAALDRNLTPSCIRWCVEAKGNWQSALHIHGELAAQSAISWPALQVGPEIGTARYRVTATGGDPRRHRARYLLDGHRLPFSHCANGPEGWSLAKPWLILAHVQHDLAGWKWTGVESLALGSAEAVVPKPGEYGQMTFAARYRDHPGGSGGMIEPGLGAIDVLLRGSLGAAFRDWFWQDDSNAGDLVALGGFVGLVPTSGNETDKARLLRLPFLARLSDGVARPWAGAALNQQPTDTGVLLGAADAEATALVLTDSPVAAPAGTSEDSLLATLSAGREALGRIVPALPVEQSFPDPAKAAPFWIAAAVSVSQIAGANSGAAPLSVIAGSTGSADGRRLGLTTMLRGIPGDLLFPKTAAAMPPLPSLLISGGGWLSVEPWQGTAPDQAGGAAQIASRVTELHAQPRFAVLRAGHEDETTYHLVTLPRSLASAMPRRRQGSRNALRHAEGARGYSLAPGADTARWLLPVLDGPIAAVRDDNASGIAGLGRSITMPAQAGPQSAEDDIASSLIWFTETRSPVYRPLTIAAPQAPTGQPVNTMIAGRAAGGDGFEAPPIPWLQTGPSRPRLPVDTDIARALGHRNALQAFLPPAAEALSVGERVGIITSRRTHLLAPVGNPFDDHHSRFGRPAQAGSSARRWIRTPRPGPLPKNQGNPDVDRRPQASPIIHGCPLRFLAGVADTIRGEVDKKIAWSVIFCAAPATGGVLSDDWDGSLRLRAEIDCLLPSVALSETPAEFLAKLLFPGTGDKAEARGTIRVGGLLVPLRWITLEFGNCWKNIDEDGKPMVNGAGPRKRATVDLLLDPNEPALDALGPPHKTLCAALRAGNAEAEVTLTVHPISKGEARACIPPGKRCRLQDTEDEAGLAKGGNRPPVTLRWVLPAVTADGGGLPVLPGSLIFCDPAHEADLAHPPVETTSMLDVADASGLILKAVFSVDRPRASLSGSLAFMVDFRSERSDASLHTSKEDIDLPGSLQLGLQLVPALPSEPARPLYLTDKAPRKPVNIAPSQVYAFPLSQLTEEHGAPATLRTGDVLVMNVDGMITLPDNPKIESKIQLDLRIILTDDPAVEPPAALYSVLARDAEGRISLPLHAQSPLPQRVDFVDLKNDFRRGLIRRSASFVWRVAMQAGKGFYVVKMDRNGQSYLPESEDEFLY